MTRRSTSTCSTRLSGGNGAYSNEPTVSQRRRKRNATRLRPAERKFVKLCTGVADAAKCISRLSATSKTLTGNLSSRLMSGLTPRLTGSRQICQTSFGFLFAQRPLRNGSGRSAKMQIIAFPQKDFLRKTTFPQRNLRERFFVRRRDRPPETSRERVPHAVFPENEN